MTETTVVFNGYKHNLGVLTGAIFCIHGHLTAQTAKKNRNTKMTWTSKMMNNNVYSLPKKQKLLHKHMSMYNAFTSLYFSQCSGDSILQK